MEILVKKLLQGDKRSAAKAISIVENNSREKNQLLNLIYQHTGKAKVIGITGSPGAGKSTLVDGLIQEIRKNGLSVGVIAVDPSSPFSGGALLGDRVRMQRHANDPEVFIRSMGNRGTLGGLSRATNETIKILDAMGKDIIIVETVGVGQSELDIINIADSITVVLNPGSGDSVQAFKAGIMEIADIFVINKSDLLGTEKLLNELKMLIDTSKQNYGWKPPIIKTISIEKKGIDLLWKKILAHLEHIRKTGILEKKRYQNAERELFLILHDIFQDKVNKYTKTNDYTSLKEAMLKKELAPTQIAGRIFDDIITS
ncbi:methylmalonyl Co-A mutase-associated GTPase MeaB [Vulcanibacillus modesticaldus]|uniref:methylmalonyl Co-A mutase-associated GTPase MeaB n=1 Tax=Vulcanibacillus modesticaldus TaxID=337097 RepID=UPI00114D3BD1|nr:methylmalonyl Co-A mutase-associated GTPase MeaB [Vulcanibacillus modesticaldus]